MTGKVPTPRSEPHHDPASVAPSTDGRREHSATTKQSLVDVARDLFTSRGYAGTSLDEVVAGAAVTKGALYHHFAGKQDLFETVYRAVEDDAIAQVNAAARDEPDPWERTVTGVREYLAVVRREDYRRIVIQEGPAVLGYEWFAAHEERSTFSLIRDLVQRLLEPLDLPAETMRAFARLFYGAMTATAAAVAVSDEPAREVLEAEGAIMLALSGIRAVVDPDAAGPAVSGLAPSAAGAGISGTTAR